MTLGPNGLFYLGSRGGMYKQTLRTALPSPGWHGGWTRSRGRLGRPSPRWNAGPPQNKKWLRFRVGPFPHGVGQTTPREALPTLGGRGHGGWLRSGGRLGWSSPRWNAGPPKKPNGQRFRMGPFPHGFGQTTPRTALPALGGRRPGGWMCSRVGRSLHPLDGTPCRHNGQRFRVGPFLHGFWPPTPQTAGRGNRVPRPRPFCPGGRPLEDEIVLSLIPA